LSKGLPDEPSAASYRGTVMHEIAAQAITLGMDKKFGSEKAIKLCTVCHKRVHDRPKEYGVGLEVDELGKTGQQVALDDVLDKVVPYVGWALDIAGDPEVEAVLVEQQLQVTSSCWGTGDFVAIYRDGDVLVGDFKSGEVEVLAKDNPQLMLYALGAITGQIAQCRDAVLVIFQNGTPDQWEVTSAELAAFRALVLDAIEEAETPSPALRVGDHCKYCPAKKSCEKYADRGMSLALQDLGGDDSLPALANLSLDTLDSETAAKVVDAIRFFGKWSAAAEKVLTDRMKAGFEIPGYKLIEGQKHKAWRDKDEAAAVLAKFPEAFNEPVLRTPTQLMKELPPGSVDDLWEQPRGEAKLVDSAARGKDWEDSSVFSD